VRYVGGSVIGRARYREGRKLDCLLQRQDCDLNRIHLAMYDILTHAAGTISNLDLTDYPNSVKEITYKMYGRLTVLTDSCYLFFLLLEKRRLEEQSAARLAQVGGSLPASLAKLLYVDPQVSLQWRNIAQGDMLN